MKNRQRRRQFSAAASAEALRRFVKNDKVNGMEIGKNSILSFCLRCIIMLGTKVDF